MAITVSDSGTRELVPPGLQLAICTEMVELGTSDDTYQGVTKPRRKVWLSFESCEEKREDGQGNTYCLNVGMTLTLSLGDKSKLRPFLESWRGRPFTPEEMTAFDLKNVLGKPCTINVMHSPKSQGNGMKAEITAIAPPRKNEVIPAQTNPTRLLEFDDFNWTVYDGLPKFLKDDVTRSKEFQLFKPVDSEPVYQPSADPTAALFGGPVDTSDDLPF